MWQRLTIQHAQSAAENKHLLMRKFFEYKYQPGISESFSERRRGGLGARRGGHPYQTNRKCHFCGGTNHFIATCRDRIKAEKEAAKNKEVSNIATDIQQPETNNNQDPADFSYQSLFPSTTQVHDEDKLWFADSGATRHMTHLKSVLKNFIPVPSRTRYLLDIF
jgi:hypothetical protein